MVPARFVRVSSLVHAPRLARGWAQQVISILDPNIRQADIPRAEDFGLGFDGWFTRFFFDIESEDNRGPTFEAVVAILQFARPASRVLVHCHAGMSRSPSIAISLLVARGMDPREAVRFVFSQNLIDGEGSFMEPNELVLIHAGRHLGIGNSLVEIMREEMI